MSTAGIGVGTTMTALSTPPTAPHRTMRMMRAAALLALCISFVCYFPTSVDAISCVDDSGRRVSWWYISTLKRKLGGGMVISTSRQPRPRYLALSVNHCDGPLKKTLDLAFDDDNALRANTGYLSYNDFTLDQDQSKQHAHARGLVIWPTAAGPARLADNSHAVWFTSSCPSFPAKQWNRMFGPNCFAMTQHLHCLSFDPMRVATEAVDPIEYQNAAGDNQDIGYRFKNYLNAIMFHLTVRRVYVTEVENNQLAALLGTARNTATGFMGYLWHQQAGAVAAHDDAMAKDWEGFPALTQTARKAPMSTAIAAQIVVLRQAIVSGNFGSVTNAATDIMIFSKAHGWIKGLWDDIVFQYYGNTNNHGQWKVSTFLSGQRHNPATCCAGPHGRMLQSNPSSGCGFGCRPQWFQPVANYLDRELDVGGVGHACQPANANADTKWIDIETILKLALNHQQYAIEFGTKVNGWCRRGGGGLQPAAFTLLQLRTWFYELRERMLPIPQVQVALTGVGCNPLRGTALQIDAYSLFMYTLITFIQSTDGRGLFEATLAAECPALNGAQLTAAWDAAGPAYQNSDKVCLVNVVAVQQWRLDSTKIGGMPGAGHPSLKGWKAESCDHSKIAWSGTTVCLGDTNRHGGRKQGGGVDGRINGGNNIRGGGALCWTDPKLRPDGTANADGTARLIDHLNGATAGKVFECNADGTGKSNDVKFPLYGMRGGAVNGTRYRSSSSSLRSSSWKSASAATRPDAPNPPRRSLNTAANNNDATNPAGRHRWSNMMMEDDGDAPAPPVVRNRAAIVQPDDDDGEVEIASDHPLGDDPCVVCRAAELNPDENVGNDAELCCECCQDWGFIEA